MPDSATPGVVSQWEAEFEKVSYWHDKPTAQACVLMLAAQVDRSRAALEEVVECHNWSDEQTRIAKEALDRG